MIIPHSHFTLRGNSKIIINTELSFVPLQPIKLLYHYLDSFIIINFMIIKKLIVKIIKEAITIIIAKVIAKIIILVELLLDFSIKYYYLIEKKFNLK